MCEQQYCILHWTGLGSQGLAGGEGKGLSESSSGTNSAGSRFSRLLLPRLCEIPPALPSAGGCSPAPGHVPWICAVPCSWEPVPAWLAAAQPSRDSKGGITLAALGDGDGPGSSRCSGLISQSCQPWGQEPEHGNSFRNCRSLGSPDALISGPAPWSLGQGWGERCQVAACPMPGVSLLFALMSLPVAAMSRC